MVTKLLRLNGEQRAKIGEYVEKWRCIALSTEKTDKKTAEEGIRLAYRELGFDQPEIVWADNPIELLQSFKSPLRTKSPEKREDPVREQIRGKLESLAWAAVCRKIHPLLREKIFKEIWEPINQSVTTITNVMERQDISLRELEQGQLDAPWLAMYDYYHNVLGIQRAACLQGHMMVAKSCGYYLPMRDICWMSKRLTAISVNDGGQLHCETKEALGYPQWKYYALNGIPMKAEYVLTPANEIKPTTILKEESADARAQLIRKAGMLKLVNHGKIIETGGYYKLIDMAPLLAPTPNWRGEMAYMPYLLMLNPSIPELYHLEGVGEECHTIEQAHAFRYKEVFKNKVVSPNGEDWWQHGDVLIYPADAITLKPFPAVIT
jgi:hypothetical protein